MKKQYRIKKSEDIEAIIKEKNVAASKNFVIYKTENHNDHFKYAISVPKKYGTAVERNKIKRQIRTIVRTNNINNKHNFFIVIKSTANTLSFLEIERELKDVLLKSQILEVQNEQQN